MSDKLITAPRQYEPARVAIDFFSQISLVKQDGIDYVTMRRVVEGIGLNWAVSSKKY